MERHPEIGRGISETPIRKHQGNYRDTVERNERTACFWYVVERVYLYEDRETEQ